MKLISTNDDLSNQLDRLTKKYRKIAFATAWASANTKILNDLVQHQDRIDVAVIGTHFYQTHPDVLDQFVDSVKVKFILQPEGVFHPKVYLFWDEHAWEVIIGSPNLTVGALTKNSELSILVTSEDGQSEMRKEISDVIRNYWGKARTIKKNDADNYRRIWKLKSRDLKWVADLYGEKEANKPAVDSRVMSMDWDGYLAEIKKDTRFKSRLEMLNEVKRQFDQVEHFNDIPLAARKGVAGFDSETIPNAKWFGSMVGAGIFHGLINHEHIAFSLALDEIPRNGEVRKGNYDRYIGEYLKAYHNGRDGIGTATRLLAMKRPDIFLCVDAKNKKNLSEDMGIVRPDKLNYERYWNEVILRIMDSPWWQSPEPLEAEEKAVWHARSAMLDAIFYEERM